MHFYISIVGLEKANMIVCMVYCNREGLYITTDN